MESSGENFGRMDRRTAVRWMLAAAASLASCTTFRQDGLPMAPPVGRAALTPSDPDLFDAVPWWERTLTPEQLRTVRALCDVIIPSDDRSPSASQVGVADFIDEWISAPYPPQQAHRARILSGIEWVEAESRRRFDRDFADLSEAEMHGICDDICYLPRAEREFREAAVFFATFRDLTASGFYTTPAGMADVGYIGNVPMAQFTGPPPEVLRRLGLGAM
jgi:hypothetical protein